VAVVAVEIQMTDRQEEQMMKRHGILALAAFLMAVAPTVHALRMSELPAEMLTSNPEPAPRALSVKLPLEQPMFHWAFTDREGFLAGTLVLRIIRGDETQSITILADGQFTEGWEAISLPPVAQRNGVYFGFISSTAYATAPGDRLEIELTVVKDIVGIGPLQEGLLPAGVYTARGTYSGLTDDCAPPLPGKNPDELPPDQRKGYDNLRKLYSHRAFLENWENQWPLTITSEVGWLPEAEAERMRQMIRQVEIEERRQAVDAPGLKPESLLLRPNDDKKLEGILDTIR